MTGLENGWRLDWGTGPFSVSRERARLYAEVVLAPSDDALREKYAALAIAEGDPIGEHVRLSLLAERAPAPWIDDALVDLRARYGRAIFAPWCASPFGRSLGGWLACRYRTSILRRGLVGHFPGFDRQLAIAEALGPIESVAYAGPHAARVGTRVRDFHGCIDESFPDNVGIAPRKIVANWARLPSFSLASCEELELIGAEKAEPGLLQRVVEAAPALRRLSFRTYERLSPVVIEAIGRLEHLEHLGMGNGAIADWGIAARRSGSFPALRSLAFESCRVDLASAAELARRTGLTTLSLQIYDDRELPTLLEGLAGAPLQSLCLAGEPDCDAPLCLTPFRTAELPNLRRLSMYELVLSDVEALSSLLPQLAELVMSHCGAGGAPLERLLSCAPMTGLRELTVPYDRMSPTAARSVAQAAPSLVRLALDADALSETELADLVAALGSLEHLRLPMHREPLAVITTGVAPRLRTLLDSRMSARPDEMLSALARSPHARTLRAVDVPDLSAVSDATIDALVSSPNLAELGEIDVYRVTSSARLDLLLRRFGHRAVLPYEAPQGPLPEPDLDPFWR